MRVIREMFEVIGYEKGGSILDLQLAITSSNFYACDEEFVRRCKDDLAARFIVERFLDRGGVQCFAISHGIVRGGSDVA